VIFNLNVKYLIWSKTKVSLAVVKSCSLRVALKSAKVPIVNFACLGKLTVSAQIKEPSNLVFAISLPTKFSLNWSCKLVDQVSLIIAQKLFIISLFKKYNYQD